MRLSFIKESRIEQQSEEFNKRKIFYSQFLKGGGVYFDIGANYGNRIGPINALKPKKIIAIEPQENCCKYLRNKYNKIVVLQMGTGAEDAEQEFYVCNESVLSSFSNKFIQATKETRFKNNNWTSSGRVKLITLDKLISIYGMPDFIKIDVEGYEYEVIKGLNQKVKNLSFEYTVPELAENIKHILAKLYSLGSCNFNYSAGESMELRFQTWLSYNEMLVVADGEEFIKSGFGDIYVQYC